MLRTHTSRWNKEKSRCYEAKVSEITLFCSLVILATIEEAFYLRKFPEKCFSGIMTANKVEDCFPKQCSHITQLWNPFSVTMKFASSHAMRITVINKMKTLVTLEVAQSAQNKQEVNSRQAS